MPAPRRCYRPPRWTVGGGCPQRRALGSDRAHATVTDLGSGVIRVTQPLPWALDHVHCYALVDPEGWTLIDAGLGTPGSLRRWTETLEGLGSPDVRRIVVTHYHPDHLGGAAALAELTGAPEVVQGALDAKLSQLTWVDLDEPAFLAFLRLHGMPEELAMASAAAEARMPVTPVTPTRLVVEGEFVEAGGVSYEVLVLPGHADGHIVLLDRREGRVFGGDVILAGITPNIGRWEDTAPDPLTRYLESLGRLMEARPKLVFPGHRAPIERVAERARELRAHHAERLEAAQAALADGARTAYEVAQRLWATSDFTLHEQRFALAEALAHVERLETESRARQVEPGRWEPA